MKQLPGYGLKTLIRPGTPGHLGPRRGPEGEGTIPTFSHWEKVAAGRMRAAPATVSSNSGSCFSLVPESIVLRESRQMDSQTARPRFPGHAGSPRCKPAGQSSRERLPRSRRPRKTDCSG